MYTRTGQSCSAHSCIHLLHLGDYSDHTSSCTVAEQACFDCGGTVTNSCTNDAQFIGSSDVMIVWGAVCADYKRNNDNFQGIMPCTLTEHGACSLGREEVASTAITCTCTQHTWLQSYCQEHSQNFFSTLASSFRQSTIKCRTSKTSRSRWYNVYFCTSLACSWISLALATYFERKVVRCLWGASRSCSTFRSVTSWSSRYV